MRRRRARWYHCAMDAPESPWGTTPYQQAVVVGERRSYLHWIIGGFVAVLVLGGGAAAYWWTTRAVSLPVSVVLDAQPLVPGSMRDLKVTVRNASPKDTALAVELAVRLPEKTTAAGLDAETASSSIEVPVVAIGDLAPGEEKEVTLVLSTELDPSSAVPVSAEATYATARDVSRRFSAGAQGELIVQQPALSLAIEAPAAVVRIAPFSASLRYRNNTDQPLTGIRLELSLPRGLTVASSTPALTSNVLLLPSIPARQQGTVALSLVPGPGAPHEMPIRATVTQGQRQLAERSATVEVSSDALAVTVLLKGQKEAPVDLNESITYQIEVRNLATIPLADIQVRATLGGSLFVLSSVQAQGGALSAREPVVTWTGVGVPGLRSLEPGKAVQLQVGVRLARTSAGAAVTAPLTVTAASPTVPPGTSATGVTATDSATGRLAAATSFAAAVHWRDPLGQVANAGPQPPQVGVATQYVVRWTISPANAPLQDAVVTASLAPGIRFTGKLGGVTSSALTYDAGTGMVTWRPGSVAANGTVSAAFQVELTPAANQKGRIVNLVTGTTLNAVDTFSSRAVKQTAPTQTTALQAGTAGSGSGVVQ